MLVIDSSGRSAPRLTPWADAAGVASRGLGNLVIIGGFAMLLLRAVSPVDFLFGFLRKSLKLAWRLLVLVNVGKFALGFLGKMAMNVMMSGGPIKAMKKSFWGGTTSLFDELASLCSRVGALSGLAAKFDDLAQVCDARASDIGGGNPFGDLGSAMGSVCASHRRIKQAVIDNDDQTVKKLVTRRRRRLSSTDEVSAYRASYDRRLEREFGPPGPTQSRPKQGALATRAQPTHPPAHVSSAAGSCTSRASTRTRRW